MGEVRISNIVKSICILLSLPSKHNLLIFHIILDLELQNWIWSTKQVTRSKHTPIEFNISHKVYTLANHIYNSATYWISEQEDICSGRNIHHHNRVDNRSTFDTRWLVKILVVTHLLCTCNHIFNCFGNFMGINLLE